MIKVCHQATRLQVEFLARHPGVEPQELEKLIDGILFRFLSSINFLCPSSSINRLPMLQSCGHDYVQGCFFLQMFLPIFSSKIIKTSFSQPELLSEIFYFGNENREEYFKKTPFVQYVL